MADPFTLPSLEPGATVLVKDTVHASGRFLLLHILKQLYGKPKHRTDAQRLENEPSLTVVLALAETFEHYASVAKKLGFPLSSLRLQGHVAWIDLTRKPLQGCFSQIRHTPPRPSPSSVAPTSPNTGYSKTGTRNDSPSLHNAPTRLHSEQDASTSTAAAQASLNTPGDAQVHLSGQLGGSLRGVQELYNIVKDVVNKFANKSRGVRNPAGEDATEKAGGGGLLIVIDDVNLLEVAADGSVDSVLTFLHYCKTLTLDNQCCRFLLLSHFDIPSDGPCSLTHALEHEAHAVLEVRFLESGHSTDVHGQVLLHQKHGIFQGSGFGCKEMQGNLLGKERAIGCLRDAESVNARNLSARYRITETGVHFTC